ncbi:MAG: 50S ribosomal protein L44e [Candidatus Hodarchaeota archaeon]
MSILKHPREVRTFCPKCNTHTAHAISIYKKGKERKVIAQGWRRFNRKKKGYGSTPRPIFKRNAKINKKTLPIATCKECGRKDHRVALRLKKFELV